jgi:hypothetical protein
LYEAVKTLARTAYDHCYGFTEGPELPEGWQSDAFAKLARLQFYADRPVATAASAAYSAAWAWGQYGKYDDPDDSDFHERQQKYDDAELKMLMAIRQSLSIPDVDPTLPPPGYSPMPWRSAGSVRGETRQRPAGCCTECDGAGRAC